jgi:hypothetical protein
MNETPFFHPHYSTWDFKEENHHPKWQVSGIMCFSLDEFYDGTIPSFHLPIGRY